MLNDHKMKENEQIMEWKTRLAFRFVVYWKINYIFGSNYFCSYLIQVLDTIQTHYKKTCEIFFILCRSITVN